MKTIILLLFVIQVRGQIISDDKTKHFYVAMGASVSVGELLYKKTNLHGISSLVGILSGIAITIGKETIYDKKLGRGTPNLNDAIVGCFGSITGGMIHRISIDIRDKHFDSKNNQEAKILQFKNSK
ncbi:MAG: hypothetical protein ABIP51_01170 [Bacteroidia bacterium]